nr:L-histidine N(alpha)-methyltransferase [Paralcaligenes ureilyticus]
MLAALQMRPRCLSPKYFYDETGSALFDRICDLPEYYPTRTELTLLAAHATEIAVRMGPRAEIVEFGAGSLRKIRLLLDAMDQPSRYVPIDISGAYLSANAAQLQHDYPSLSVLPIMADYTGAFHLPVKEPSCGRRIGFFPGSTIGNLLPADALKFLRQAAQSLRGGALLLGVDLIKNPSVLHAAYNDSQGITAAFNLNLLTRANRELDANFDVSRFAHSAFYNAPMQRVEMHLISRAAQHVRVCGERFDFAEGETLHTENSYKFTVEGLRALASQAGFHPGQVWVDPQKLFSLHWLPAPL